MRVRSPRNRLAGQLRRDRRGAALLGRARSRVAVAALVPRGEGVSHDLVEAVKRAEATLDDREEVLLVLDEPSIDDDFEGWAAWFDELKARRDELAAFTASLGVRALPTATKGVGWGDAPSRQAEAECATLHGQAGAGR